MHILQERYKTQIIPSMKKKFGYKNDFQVPWLKKVVINVGVGQGLKDPKYNDVVENTLSRITGQKPIKTLAKKSISNFKVRKGLIVGMKVTLRGKRMLDFIEKFVGITLPRIRDFRGIGQYSIDQSGNLSVGIREHIAFPEIKSDEVEKIHGVQISIRTNAKSNQEGLELFKELGFPFHTEKPQLKIKKRKVQR